MEVKEVIKLKAELEMNIFRLIESFEAETGVKVSSVDFSYVLSRRLDNQVTKINTVKVSVDL